MYTDTWPQPDGLEGRPGGEGATSDTDVGLVLLPWDVRRRTKHLRG
jgi:hypothetical protein